MILADLQDLRRYQAVLPALAKVAAFLAEMPLASRALGRHELDGAALYVNIEDCVGRGREASPLEVHRRYVDVQIALSAKDVIGWRPIQECSAVKAAYDETRDIAFFSDAVPAWFDLVPGQFALFFPEDAHAPLAGSGPVRKAVFKIQIG